MSTASVLFADFANQWADLALPMCPPATAATQRSHVAWFTQPEVLGALPVSQVTWAATQQAFNDCRTQFSPKTLRNRWGTLRLVLKRAQAEGHLSVILAPKLPHNPRRAQPSLAPDSMRTVLTATAGDDHVFCWLLAETGMRIGEAIGLYGADLQVATRQLHIQRDIYRGQVDRLKTYAAERTISLSRALVRKLDPLLEKAKGGFLFQTRQGTPWWPTEVQKRLDRVFADTEVPRGAFHAWRRGNITLAGKVLGMPEPLLAQRVGHQLPSLTFGLYQQEINGYDREWAERISVALGKGVRS